MKLNTYKKSESLSRIHPEVLPHSADVLSRDFDGDVMSLKKMFDSRPVVASTCLGINHPAIGARKFDFCIFDEAGQALLLATLGPLFHCRKFILVGDPQQVGFYQLCNIAESQIIK